MSSLFDKLNLLVRSRMNSVVDDLLDAPAKMSNHLEMRKQVSKDLEALRQQIQNALTYEQDLESQVQEARQTRDKWLTHEQEATRQQEGQPSTAFEHQRAEAETRLMTLERMLQEHRVASDTLIQQVSKLDHLLAEQATTPVSSPTHNLTTAQPDPDDEDDTKMEQRRSRLSAPSPTQPKS